MSRDCANEASEQVKAVNVRQYSQANAMQSEIRKMPGPINKVKSEVQKIERRIQRRKTANSCMSRQVGKTLVPYSKCASLQRLSTPKVSQEVSRVPTNSRSRCRYVRVALMCFAALGLDPCIFSCGLVHSGTVGKTLHIPPTNLTTMVCNYSSSGRSRVYQHVDNSCHVFFPSCSAYEVFMRCL